MHENIVEILLKLTFFDIYQFYPDISGRQQQTSDSVFFISFCYYHSILLFAGTWNYSQLQSQCVLDRSQRAPNSVFNIFVLLSLCHCVILSLSLQQKQQIISCRIISCLIGYNHLFLYYNYTWYSSYFLLSTFLYYNYTW